MKKHKQSLYIILCIINIAILLGVLPGCFAKNKQVISTDWWEFNQYRESQSFSLAAGVYQIHVEPLFEAGDWMEVGLRGTGNNFRSLLGNPVIVNSAKESVDFVYYVLPGARHVTLYYNMLPEVEVSFLELTVEKGNQGNRILFVIVFFFLLLVDVLVVFRQWILDGKISKKQQVTVVGMLGLLAMGTFPLWTDYMIDTENSMAYLGHVEMLLQDGVKGFAEAFLGDALYLLPMLFRRIGFDVTISYKILCTAVILLTLCLVFGAGKVIYRDAYAGLFGGMVMLVLPWNISLLYQKGDLAAFLLQGVMAMGVAGLYLLLRGDDNEKMNGITDCVIAIVLFLLSGQVLRREITPVVWCLVMAACSGLLSLTTGWVYGKMKEKCQERFFGVVIVCVFLCLLPALYRLNMIVFEAQPNYLYTAESIPEEYRK